MNNWWQDVVYAARVLRKNWFSTLVILISLGIGIGANSAIFSVVDALLLRPLPYPQPERLAGVWLHSPALAIFRDWPSPGQYIDLQNGNHSFEQMTLAQTRPWILAGREQPEHIDGMRTQSTLFTMLGAKAQIGRLLLPEEDAPGKPPVAILSDRVWKRLFNGDREIVGKTIVLDGTAFTVAGVLQREFSISSEVMPSENPMDRVDIFTPLPLGADAAQQRRDENYNILVKLKPGVTVQQAQADINVIASRIQEKDKRDASFGMHITALQDEVVGDVRRALLVLLGSVGLVLLIACANVANLLLARGAAREKEIAVRTAMGAGWMQIAGQLLTESVLLGALGGVVGLGVAQASLFVVRAMNPGNIPRLEEIGINGAVMAFTFGVSLLTGVLFGLAPVWRALKIDLNTSLKAGGRAGQGDGGLLVRRHRLRGLLVISELALSLMLLIGAGLLVRSFVRLQAVPPGFSADHVITMQMSATDRKYKDEKLLAAVFRDIEARTSALPGVVAQGQVGVLPLTGSVGWGSINVEGFTPNPGQELQVDMRNASADYFSSMKIPLRMGRFFSEHDTQDVERVVIIDDRFASRFWPNGDALGKHLWFDPKRKLTIVGVVGSVKQYGLETDGKIAMYFAQQQFPSNTMFLTARTSGDPGSISSAVVSAVHGADPTAVVYDARSMDERVYDSLARQRFASTMLAAFATFAVLVAAVGLYGVMSYLVTQSTRDIGVMVALGARSGDIIGLVMRQGMELAGIGILAGIVGAVALTRVMASLLFGISATDLVTFGIVPLLLAAVAFAATVIPAWRTTRVDPVVALRDE
ncbi:MAG TPA: ABC transporter permease [Candidatus Sulfotelmatobacter sp.]|nr:ABC transporter permease [Candidatus Sulfotelmatobacter sp.]